VSNKKSNTKTMELWIAIIGFIGLVWAGLVVVAFGMEKSQAGAMAFDYNSVANTAMNPGTGFWFENQGVDSLLWGLDNKGTGS
jgi:hypothetical protein